MIFKGFSLILGVVLLMMPAAGNPVFAQDEEGDAAISATAIAEDAGPKVRVLPSANTSSSDGSGRSSSDQEDAWDAKRRGLVMPYGLVLKKVKQASPGDVVKVRLLKRVTGYWTYEVTVLDARGHYTQLSLNAKTGAVLKKKIR